MHTGKSMYGDYCEAISLALDYTRERKGDPNFLLGIVLFADVSTLSQKTATPKQSDSLRRSLNSHTNSLPRKSCSSKSSTNSTDGKCQNAAQRRSNQETISSTSASPSLADYPRDVRDEVRSRNRKRSRDPTATHGDDSTSSESAVKRQRTNSDEI